MNVLIPTIGSRGDVQPFLALAAWHIVIIIAQVRGAVAASNGQYFRYPMIIRFIS